MDDKHRAVLLRTMRDFEKFCDKAGLQWYMAFGSAIGTVRHKGIIPWDDDIDVFMPRPDYERLLGMKDRIQEIAGNSLEGEYELIGARTSEADIPFMFTKFCDLHTTVWEKKHYPVIVGVFIDIFPLDRTGDDVEENRRLKEAYHDCFRKYRRSFRSHSFRSGVTAFFQGRFSESMKFLTDNLFYRPRKKEFKEEFCRLDRSMAERTGDNLISLSAYSAPDRVCWPASFFASAEEVTFENMTVKLPAGNDAILRQIYGDYMQLPPKFERVSGHSQYFADFTRRMTLREAKAEIQRRKKKRYSGQ